MNDVTLLEAVVVAIPALILIGYTLVDVVRRPDLTGPRKAAWLIVAVIPVIGTILYLLARPLSPARWGSAPSGARVARFVEMLERRERGDLPKHEFVAATHQLLDQDRL